MNKLQYALDNKLFTDLTLTLQDDHNEITCCVHKIILYSNCIYFEKLLLTVRKNIWIILQYMFRMHIYVMILLCCFMVL